MVFAIAALEDRVFREIYVTQQGGVGEMQARNPVHRAHMG